MDVVPDIEGLSDPRSLRIRHGMVDLVEWGSVRKQAMEILKRSKDPLSCLGRMRERTKEFLAHDFRGLEKVSVKEEQNFELQPRTCIKLQGSGPVVPGDSIENEVKEDNIVREPAMVIAAITPVLDKQLLPCVYGDVLSLNEHLISDNEVAVVMGDIRCIFFVGTGHLKSPFAGMLQMLVILWKSHVLIARIDLPPDPGVLLQWGWYRLGRFGTEEDKAMLQTLRLHAVRKTGKKDGDLADTASSTSILQDMNFWESNSNKLANRWLHPEATDVNPEDPNIIRNNERGGNMVIDTGLNGTVDIEGSQQNSSSSDSKRFIGDDDDSISVLSLSAGSFNECRRVQ
jgi:hypothetical protein